MKLNTNRWVVAGAMVSAFAFAPGNQAIPTLKLMSGPASVTVADGSILDINAAVGAVTFSGVVGSFILNVSTGLSDPILGSVTFPHLDLSSVNVSSSVAGPKSLTILFSDDGFGPTPPGTFTANIGGTAGGAVKYNTFLSPTDVLFGGSSGAPLGTGVLLSSLGAFGGGAFSGTAGGAFGPLAGPYAVTLEVSLVHASGIKVTSFNAELVTLPVPDGGATAVLLGLGLLGMGVFSRRTV